MIPFLLLLISASAVWAQPLGADYPQTFDFSAAPITLTPGGTPLMLNVDYGEQFASYEDVFISVTFQNATKHITTLGLLLSNQAAPPSYASATEWGYAVMTGSSSSVTPSTSFSWTSGYGSEHWLDVGASEIAQEILDGQFTFFFQNAPLSQSPGLTSKEDLVVLSAEVVLRGAVIAPEPAPIDTDNDGVNNYREGKDGTDPNDANSFNPLSKGLVGYYPFEGNADDESGTGKDGVATAITYESSAFGPSGSSALFTRGSALDIPSLTGLQFRPITYSLWVYFAGIENNAQTTLIGRKQAWNQEDGGVCVDTRFGHQNELMYHTGATAITSGLNVALGEWYHIVFTQDTNSQATFYVNGELRVSQLFTAAQTATSFPFRLGAESALAGISTGEGIFDGKMDNVRIYNRALSPTEVGQLYQTEAGNLDSDGDGLTDAWERGYGRYQIVEGNFTWDQAKADAEAKGGHLGTITSEDEKSTMLALLVGRFLENDSYYLGATDAQAEGQWEWVTEETWEFTDWAPLPSAPDREPNGGSSENYLTIFAAVNPPWDPQGTATKYRWNDASASHLAPYILEFGYPTDPFKADTDGDGYDDKVESDAGTDPNNPASKPVPPDTDGDGIPDAYETNTGVYVSPTDTGTDPNNPDSDGDTLPDGVETASYIYIDATDTGTDPNLPDTDGDGLSDNVETNTGIYVSATDTGTSPLLDDTSGDGITDGEAVAAQFNPLIDQRPVLNFLTQAVAAQPNRFGFYNEANVMHLGMGGLMIRKSGSVVNLDLQWQTKNSLTNAWTNHGAPLPFFLNLPGSKAFIRLQATPGAP